MFDDYSQARDALVDANTRLAEADPDSHAQAAEAHAAAVAALAVASEPLAAEIDAAWEANRQAVADSAAAITTALAAQAAVEVACGTAARERAVRSGRPGMPVFNDDEIARINEARDLTDAARDEHRAAKDRFKGGVTAEQLGA